MNLLFVRHLTVIDFSYLHPKRGVVGESWIVDLELEGDLDEQGMVFDFGHVKKTVKAGIDRFLDHKLVVPLGLDGLRSESSEGYVSLHLELPFGEILHRSPDSAVALLELDEITSEQVEPILNRTLKNLLPQNVKQVRVKLRQEQIEGAFYHYSHGLKKHDGNCQRIAHGHRSRLEIYVDRARVEALEQEWASQWQDIYIATREDLKGSVSLRGADHLEFSYQADQGEFFIRLPARSVYLIESDTTVEWIAHHIAQRVKQRHPTNSVEVRAFEGVDKGSIAIA